MNIETNTPSDYSVFQDGPYDKEILVDNINYESKKTRNAIWAIALILFLSDLFALLMANVLTPLFFLYILVVPAIFFSFGFIAKSQQVLAMTITTVVFVALLAYTIFLAGATSIISGFLIKAVVIYFFIKGFNHAFEAKKAKENLKLLNL